MSTATDTRLAQELRAICGGEHVSEVAAVRTGVAPAMAVMPASADEVAAVLRFANAHGLSVFPAGGLSQQMGASTDLVLYTTRLTEVEHYDPGDLTVGVGAGWKVADLCNKVRHDDLYFAGDPAHRDTCTIGGLLATGMNGPHRHGYGGLRDYCIGIRFVTGDGRKGKGGGRVVKNVAGYDLMKLLIGSWGTLAVVTSASFKLFPRPRQTRTFLAEFMGVADAVAFRDRMLRSPLDPICLEMVSPGARSLMRPEMADSRTWVVCVRAAGSDAVLARYRSELGLVVSREITGDDEMKLWQAIANFSSSAAEARPDSLLLSFMLALGDVQPALNDLEDIAKANGCTLAVVGRVGVGHVMAALVPEGSDNQRALRAVSALRNRLPDNASLTVLHAPRNPAGDIALWPKTPSDIESMRRVKQALDPNNILSRGRLLF